LTNPTQGALPPEVWKPTAKQKIMLASTAKFILFGGS